MIYNIILSIVFIFVLFSLKYMFSQMKNEKKYTKMLFHKYTIIKLDLMGGDIIL